MDQRSRTWSSRQRLLKALNCGVPDRVPISTYELVGYNSKAWENSEPSYRRLMDRIRRDTDCLCMWDPPSDAQFLYSAYPVKQEMLCEQRGSMTRRLRTLQTPRGELRSVTEDDPAVHTTWVVEHWCKNLEDVDKALSVPYVKPRIDASDYQRVRREVRDHGLIMGSPSDPGYVAADLMSFEDFTVWAFEQSEHFARTVEVVAERVMDYQQALLEACPVDLYRICGPEYFTPPYLPPSFFARFVEPYVRQMVQLIHRHGAKARLHCHGRIDRVLDMFLKTGCDATDPCEPPPDGDVELDEVKRRCAAHGVCVFGNTELKLLEGSTPEHVRAHVCRVMDQAKEGGGFVLMPTAAPINVPLSKRTEENYFVWIDAALEQGKY